MAHANDQVSDELCEELHTVVNMTSRALSDWLMVRSPSDQTETTPGQAGTETGQAVVHILGKQPAD